MNDTVDARDSYVVEEACNELGGAAAGAQNSAQGSAETEVLINITKGRIATYGLLSRLYYQEVDAALLDELCQMRMPTNTGSVQADEAYRMLHGYLNGCWERTLTELAVDYARVFLGNGINAYSAAYPYESVHTSSKRLLMQEARDEVLAIYRANGIKKCDKWKLGEDHIALELEFEQIMTMRSLDALQENDEATAAKLMLTQYNFLVDHLLAWAPMLNDEMQKFAHTNFYRALGKLTMGFLQAERELLQDLLADELALTKASPTTIEQ
ncbi:MAG: molecular chaperone TorD family protein [Coriobacteriales bacterium]|jgi:TorA maturation chaperone TorD|nr:molecular chaperone TorD family protein [Coriobacteriales bacterium]